MLTQQGWKEFSSRQDLIGRDVEEHTEANDKRGTVTGVAVEGQSLIVRVAWTATRWNMKQGWCCYSELPSCFFVPIDTCSDPLELEDGRIKIRINHLFGVAIWFLPVGDNLNPSCIPDSPVVI